MELRVLKYFLMVAREENITRAAEQLHMTQPTLSRQLMQLEDELGVKLFVRSRHNIMLTEDGLLLKRRAQEILSLTEKTKNEIQKHDELAGEIVIGCGETKSMSVLSEKIRQFREKYPLVTFRIYSANADDVKERIEQGIVDIGLLMEPVDIGKYNFIRMPTNERWGVYARNDSSIALKCRAEKDDLSDIPLIMPGRERVQNELASWFGDSFDKLNVAARYNLIMNAANMVKHGIGTALSFEFDIKFDDVVFVPLSPELKTGSVIVWKKNQMYSALVSRFIEELRNA